MSNENSVLQKNRFRTAAQWIQAITTFCILGICYSAASWADDEVILGGDADMAPLYFEQQVFWDHSQESSPLISQSSTKTAPISGVIFEDPSVRVSYYSDLPLEEIEKNHTSDIPRAFSYSSQGIAVIEGDINSSSAQKVVSQLHTR